MCDESTNIVFCHGKMYRKSIFCTENTQCCKNVVKLVAFLLAVCPSPTPLITITLILALLCDCWAAIEKWSCSWRRNPIWTSPWVSDKTHRAFTQSRVAIRAANQVSAGPQTTARRMLGPQQMRAAARLGFNRQPLRPIIQLTMCLLGKQHRKASSPVIPIMLIISEYSNTFCAPLFKVNLPWHQTLMELVSKKHLSLKNAWHQHYLIRMHSYSHFVWF